MKIREFLAARWRWLVLVFLVLGPIVFLVGVGIYALWIAGWWFWVWWPLTACFTLALVLAWRWQQKQQLLELDFTPSLHWTDRDREAWKLVEARAQAGSKIPSERLVTINFYTETAQEMALELARVYHPHAKDPLASRTVPEILAVIELASSDLADMVDQYLPGGHFMSIDHWKKARQAADWYQTASAFSWMIAGIFNPAKTAARFLASQAGMSMPWQMLQQNLLLWFYGAFVHRMGTYLIDLNSGRLRVGARRYRELTKGAVIEANGISPEEPVSEVNIVLFGQSKMGKSSLINALLGEQRPRTSVLPETAEISRYELVSADSPTKLVVSDTVGYSQAGPREDQLKTTFRAARGADLLLLVLHARNPARQADLDMLNALTDYFVRHPELKKPPILAVLTHIDLLSPSLEWSPPYDWQNPTRPKEHQIAQALSAAQTQFGPLLAGMVPVCTASGRVHGIDEWLLPAMVELLGEARAVGLVRILHAEGDAHKIRKTLGQLLETAKAAAKILWRQ